MANNNTTSENDGHFDDSLPIIIGVCVSVGAVMVIVFIAVTILLYRRKKQAMVKKASFHQRPDPATLKTNEGCDAGNKPESPRIVEPYSVITLNEYTTTAGITTPKRFIVAGDDNTTTNSGITLKTFSETGFQGRPNESNGLRNSEALLGPDTRNVELGLAHCNLDNTNPSNQVNVDGMQLKRRPTLSEYYPEDSIPERAAAGKEHIYFELEPEFVTPHNQENLNHQ